LAEVRSRLASRSPPEFAVFGDDGTEGREAASKPAAVLIPLIARDQLTVLFTQRTTHLKSHAGQVSFPGGRVEHGDASAEFTALREAEEEIGLAPAEVDVVVALPPIGTFVTSYKVHPFVGLIGERLSFEPNPAEVETVLAFTLESLRESFQMRRLVRRGIPFRTPTYLVDDHLIWGATARILGELLERLDS
jgi:8-oxo-dGTP pyrophosphatase MutT (NUDIX family)